MGIVDSRLPTVGVFADIATPASATPESATSGSAEAESASESEKFERGVVFYLRGKRVVGVLLWNLFNRMHLARQVRTLRRLR